MLGHFQCKRPDQDSKSNNDKEKFNPDQDSKSNNNKEKFDPDRDSGSDDDEEKFVIPALSTLIDAKEIRLALKKLRSIIDSRKNVLERATALIHTAVWPAFSQETSLTDCLFLSLLLFVSNRVHNPSKRPFRARSVGKQILYQCLQP